MLKVKGCRSLRHRLVLAHISGRPLRIDDIRAQDENPGLRDFEANLLRLLERITNGTVVEIDETGTRLKYRPGVVMGGANITHDCGTGRAIGYYLEPLVTLALFAKRPLSITLTGITNDDVDVTVDTWRSCTLPLLRKAGVPADGLELKVVRRGAAPLGGGEVLLRVPTVKELPSLDWTDEGMIKRIRGVAFTCKVSPQAANRMVDASRGMLNKLLPDVFIFTDHHSGKTAGGSPGFGLSLVAETTNGFCLSADGAMAAAAAGARVAAEDVGERVTAALLDEIALGGAVDGAHQVLALLLAALGPERVSKLRLGRLAPPTVHFLRDLKLFTGLVFHLEPDAATGTVLATCVGLGLKNVARRVT